MAISHSLDPTRQGISILLHTTRTRDIMRDMKPNPVRLLLTVAQRGRRIYWRVRKPSTVGVKVALQSGKERFLVVRTSYEAAEHFVFPGGRVRRGEEPAAAARRELFEECGIELKESDLRLASVHVSTQESKRDTIHLFYAAVKDEPEPKASMEVRATAWLSASDPRISSATQRRIHEIATGCTPDTDW